MMYLGDFVEGYNNLIFYWNTNDANGASVTRSTDGTLKLIRSDGTDCTTGSLTDTEDSPDTGIHKCTVDLSINDKCLPGYDYTVWVDGAVIATRTVNAALAQFSIENRFNPVEAIAGSGSNPLNLQDVINDVNSQTILTESNIRGTDDDTLKTLSGQIDGISAGSGATIDQVDASLDNLKLGSDNDNIYIQKRYETATTIYFSLTEYNTTNSLDVNIENYIDNTRLCTHISIDGGSIANSTNNFTNIGKGIYAFSLTAAELTGNVISISIIDTESNPSLGKLWNDKSIFIDTVRIVSRGSDVKTT